jgi:hypothetical protein
LIFSIIVISSNHYCTMSRRKRETPIKKCTRYAKKYIKCIRDELKLDNVVLILLGLIPVICMYAKLRIDPIIFQFDIPKEIITSCITMLLKCCMFMVRMISVIFGTMALINIFDWYDHDKIYRSSFSSDIYRSLLMLFTNLEIAYLVTLQIFSKTFPAFECIASFAIIVYTLKLARSDNSKINIIQIGVYDAVMIMHIMYTWLVYVHKLSRQSVLDIDAEFFCMLGILLIASEFGFLSTKLLASFGQSKSSIIRYYFMLSYFNICYRTYDIIECSIQLDDIIGHYVKCSSVGKHCFSYESYCKYTECNNRTDCPYCSQPMKWILYNKI